MGFNTLVHLGFINKKGDKYANSMLILPTLALTLVVTV